MPTATRATRKPIRKSVRFEVFKRDLFTCQYCGSKAPDAVLHIDHILAVSKGGSNDLLNLITSCIACNLGKGDRALDDRSAVARQRKAVEEDAERIEQVKMLAQWARSRRSVEEVAVDEFKKYVEHSFRRSVTESGSRHIRRWVGQFPHPVLFEAIDICARQYLTPNGTEVTDESARRAFDYIPRIAAVRADPDPRKRQVAYIAGILRNRLAYFGPQRYREMMRDAVNLGLDLDMVQEKAKACRNWTSFVAALESMLTEAAEAV